MLAIEKMSPFALKTCISKIYDEQVFWKPLEGFQKKNFGGAILI